MRIARRPHTTMNDIARAADVSQSTVSRILSGAPATVPVSEATRERVLATAQRLGYRPNPLARGLKGAPTMLIGAIVRDITDPFFATAIDALSLGARAHGYSVVLGHARGRAEEALVLAAVLEARQCDAIILLGDIHEQPRLLSDLASVDVPVIELWQGSHDRELPAIGGDNAGGMRAVLAHLADLGHRRIAFAGDPAKADVRERQAAYTAFMSARGESLRVHESRNTATGGAATLDALLAAEHPPTAVAAATDVLAFGVLHRAAALRLRVPEDLSVTGFDDIPLAATAVPALTTVRSPIADVVEAAVALATDRSARPRSRATTQTFPTELVVRRSTGPCGGER